MNLRSHTKISTAPIDQIDLQDDRYLIPCYSPIDWLVRSVQVAGVINAPLLSDTGGSRLVPILGRRRIEALRLLGVESVNAHVISEISEAEAFRIAFWDNVAHRPVNPAYVGVVVKRLLELFPTELVAREFLPALGTPASGPRIERIRKIGGLGKSILDALGQGRILEKTALLLTELKVEDRLALMDLVVRLRLNANKAAEVVGTIFDLSVYNSLPMEHYIHNPETQDILNDHSLSIQDKAARVRSLLARLKHPETEARLAAFESWRSSVPASRRVAIKPYQGFETPGCTIEIKADSLEFAKRALSALDKIEK